MEPDRKREENSSWNQLSKWETYVDERIRQMIGDGNMSWHPGAGKPLDLENDENVPEDLRLAYKLMRENDTVPPWVALGATLRDKREKLLARLQQYARDYITRKQEALMIGSYVRDRHAEDRWQEAIKRWAVDCTRYNGEMLDYNLSIPPQIEQMIPIAIHESIEEALDSANRNR